MTEQDVRVLVPEQPPTIGPRAARALLAILRSAAKQEDDAADARASPPGNGEGAGPKIRPLHDIAKPGARTDDSRTRVRQEPGAGT